MNLVLLEAEELDLRGGARLLGARARHMREVLGVVAGSEVRVGVIEGPRGVARVVRVDADAVELSCALHGEAPARPRVDVLMALPRPKVLKRLFAPLAALGLGRLWLTNAARVERCYFDSHVLREEVHRPLLLEGLAQARDTRVPEVRVERALKPFVEDTLDGLAGDARRVLTDPVYRRSPLDVALETNADRRVLLALGPEGGWSDYERDLFERHGFVGVGLGPRTLRSDTAVTALLAIVHEGLRCAAR